MQPISIKAMLEAGAHFGHQTHRWNPKMAKYIYGHRNNIHIIDLQKSAKELRRALKFVDEMKSKGKKFLFVGTKRQAQEAIKTEAQRCGAFYVSHRWIGGLLTNFDTVKKSIARLLEMEKMLSEGILDILNKKEGRKFNHELASLRLKYGGVKEIQSLPDVLFVIDPTEEATAVLEAYRMHVPVIAVCDTDANPDMITYPIPGNDDAVRSIRFFTASIAQAILDAQEKSQPLEPSNACSVGSVAADATPETEAVTVPAASESSEDQAASAS